MCQIRGTPSSRRKAEEMLCSVSPREKEQKPGFCVTSIGRELWFCVSAGRKAETKVTRTQMFVQVKMSALHSDCAVICHGWVYPRAFFQRVLFFYDSGL